MSFSLSRALRRTPAARSGADAAHGLRRLAATAWRRWFLDRHTEFWLRELRPGWSLTETRARVVDILDETADTRTFVLAPGRGWPGHRAGQFVPVELEIAGVRTRRCYTISSGGSRAGAARIAITVRRVASGRASRWLHDELAPGDLVTLGTPGGEFVAPDMTSPRKLLLVGGGSGITPIMAIVRDLAERAVPLAGVTVIHAAHTAADAIFARALATLADTTELRVVTHYRDEQPGRLSTRQLRALVPDLHAHETFVCGPPGLVDVVTGAVTAVGAAERLHVERFVATPNIVDDGAARTLALTTAGRRVIASGPGPLLVQLERAGERPAHGCRMGICNTCRCRKVSGTVEDALTGAISSEPDQDIRLCVAIARSDLELAL